MPLPVHNYWELEGSVDSARFFEALWTRFPQATTFYAEGTLIASDIIQFYESNREEGDYLPATQTLLPRPRQFRCRFSSGFAAGMSGLARTHAEPELLDHLALYEGSTGILFWHDAFENVLLVSRSISKDVASAFAADLGFVVSNQ